MKKRMVELLGLGVACLAVGTMECRAISYSFADALQPGGSLLANGATMSGSLVKIGAGTYDAAVHGTNPGVDPAEVGGPYDGVVFDLTADTDPDPTLVTRIQGTPRETVDEGQAHSHGDAVGLYIHFDMPTLLEDFFILDLDGEKTGGGDGNPEWAASFAFNGDALISPMISLNPGGSDLQQSLKATTSWNTALDIQGDKYFDVASASRATVSNSMQMVVNTSTDKVHADPDDPYTQALFDYNTLVTDLFVLWGIEYEVGGKPSKYPQQSSGITGFSIPDSVPDPGATMTLLGLALLSLAALRRK